MRGFLPDEKSENRSRQGGGGRKMHNVLSLCQYLPETGDHADWEKGDRTGDNQKVFIKLR